MNGGPALFPEAEAAALLDPKDHLEPLHTAFLDLQLTGAGAGLTSTHD